MMLRLNLNYCLDYYSDNSFYSLQNPLRMLSHHTLLCYRTGPRRNCQTYSCLYHHNFYTRCLPYPMNHTNKGCLSNMLFCNEPCMLGQLVECMAVDKHTDHIYKPCLFHNKFGKDPAEFHMSHTNKQNFLCNFCMHDKYSLCNCCNCCCNCCCSFDSNY